MSCTANCVKKKLIHGKYDTPTQLNVKWRMDVKYVTTACYSGNDDEKFYQYTMIEEASRKRFIYPYKEQNGYSTVDFVKRAITFFGYVPKIIQTDKVHIFDQFCDNYCNSSLDLANAAAITASIS